MVELMQELTWEIIADGGSSMFMAFLAWYLVAKQIPATMETNRTALVDAIQQARNDFRDALGQQRAHDKEVREANLARLEVMLQSLISSLEGRNKNG